MISSSTAGFKSDVTSTTKQVPTTCRPTDRAAVIEEPDREPNPPSWLKVVAKIAIEPKTLTQTPTCISEKCHKLEIFRDVSPKFK